MLDLGPHLRRGLLDLALGFVQGTALAQFLIGAAGRAPPDDLVALMFGAFLHSGVAGIGTLHVFLAVQQLIDLGDIGPLGRRATPLCTKPNSATTPMCAFMPQYH